MGRFQYLWQQYIRKKASDQELDELFSFIADPANKSSIVDFLESLGNAEQPLQNYDPRQWQWLVDASLNQAKKNLTAEIRHSTPQPERNTGKPNRGIHFIKRWSWAAAVAFLIGSGTYFLVSRKNEKPFPAVVHYKGDVQPGHNGAVLHLSNGNTIVLDSTEDGIIALQGSVKAVKMDGALEYVGKTGEVIYNTVATDRGRQWKLILPDGTKVWLNAASSIRYPLTFIGPEREVEITGEAYFEVVHNTRQPFKVKAGDQVIEDIGTAFNVNVYSDEPFSKTTLVEGMISVNGAEIKPGQQAVVQHKQVSVSAADINQALAWKNGFFGFDHADIQTVMRQLSRWYNVEVKYEGLPENAPFQGKIDRNLTLAQVLNVLEQVHVHFRIEEDKRIVIMP
jgi:ferric-dicitrate binding protein FerR (iron transport regulator)